MKYSVLFIGIMAVWLTSFVVPPAYAAAPMQDSPPYVLPWPGILPDRKVLYAIKVVRNRLIARMLSDDVKRVEFYLLMSDKTLYASRLLADKGEFALAKETALKGENFFSMLVSVYARVAPRIPQSLDDRIDRSYAAHQSLLESLASSVPESDGGTFRDVDYFSKTNYRLIEGMRTVRKQQ